MGRAKLLMAAVGLLMSIGGNALATIHHVDIANFSFSPTKTVVSPDDTVRWTLMSGVHTTTSDVGSPKSWNSGTMSVTGTTWDVVFTAGDGPGPFPYHCGVHPTTMKDTIFMAATAIRFAFQIDEAQANDGGGTGSSATGFGVLELNAAETELTIHVEHNVSGINGAHIHFGAPGVGGGIRFAFASPASPIDETWMVTSTDVTDLLAGDLYVNLHSSSFPGGEIRGQIVQQEMLFTNTLDEAQAAAGVGTKSAATGFGVYRLNTAATDLQIDVTHDVVNIIDGHIHLGAPGVDGNIQFGFASSTSPIGESWSMGVSDVINLLAGDLYTNLHSNLFAAGEIRGQIVPSQAVFTFFLDEAQANAGAGTGSPATGFGVGVLSADQSQFDITVVHDVSSPIDGHIHLGAPGVDGAIQFGFASSTSPITETWMLSSGDVDNLLAGDLYVNLHSSSFMAGEIRGQIVQTKKAYSFSPDEAQADLCNGTGSPAVGTYSGILKAEGAEFVLTGTHDVVDAVDAHIHNAVPCVDGQVSYALASFLSPTDEHWYLTPDDIIDLLNGELYLNIHSLAFVDGEIRGQIENASGCCLFVGDVDHSGGAVPVDVIDVLALVAYLFQAGAVPVCLDETDATGGCEGVGPDVIDLLAIVGYLFQGAGDLPPCHTCGF